MPSTRNIQDTLRWCGSFVNFQPLLIGGNEPALNTANLVKQTILGPPFCWRWNRGNTSVVITPAGQDYTQAMSDFGFIEKGWLVRQSDGEVKELQVMNALGQDDKADRPAFIAAQYDDGNGNITFRVMPKPDQNYTLVLDYQRKAAVIQSISTLWSPIPDEMCYVAEWGYLGIVAILSDDPRFPIFNRTFTSHLLGNQAGLDEMQRNLFLGNWTEVMRAAQSTALKTKQGIDARA